MKKRWLLSVLIICFIAMSAGEVFSIGLSSQQLPPYIVAEPGKEFKFTFIANGYGSDTDPYVTGDLLDYVTLSEPNDLGNWQKSFVATVKFPDVIEEKPGMHTILVGAAEIADNPGGGISVKTKVQSPLRFFILYPGKYIEANLFTQNVNINETAEFRVVLKNFGVPFLELVQVSIDIIDANNTKVRTIDSGYFSLESGQKRTRRLDLNTTGMTPGNYKAVANITYDGEYKILEGNFKVGQMKVNVLNFTQTLYAEKINKFKVNVENQFNGPVSNVNAKYIIETQTKNISSKTASENIGKLSTAVLSGFIDINETEPGEYPARIEVYYENDKSVERGTVTIVEAPLQKITGNVWFWVGLGVLAVIILLTVLNVMLFMKRKK